MLQLNSLKFKLDKVSVGLFSLFFLFLPFSSSAVEMTFGLLFLTMAAGLFCMPDKKQHIAEFIKNKWVITSFILFIAFALSIFPSSTAQHSFDTLISKWGEAFLYFLFAYFVFSHKDLRLPLMFFLIASVIVCVDGIFQKITGQDFIRSFSLVENYNGWFAVRASFKYYNAFAAYLIVAFFINLASLQLFKNVKIKIVIYLTLVLILINLVFSYSRGAWLAWLAACLISVLFIPQKQWKYLLAFVVLFASIICFYPSLSERFFFTFKSGFDTGRITMWRGAFVMFKDSMLLGQGLGTFMGLSKQYIGGSPTYAHNCYLQILAETGLTGFIAFTVMLGLWVIKSIAFILSNKDDLFFKFLFIALCAFLMHAFVDVHFYSLQLSMMFWVLLGISAAYMDKVR